MADGGKSRVQLETLRENLCQEDREDVVVIEDRESMENLGIGVQNESKIALKETNTSKLRRNTGKQKSTKTIKPLSLTDLAQEELPIKTLPNHSHPDAECVELPCQSETIFNFEIPWVSSLNESNLPGHPIKTDQAFLSSIDSFDRFSDQSISALVRHKESLDPFQQLVLQPTSNVDDIVNESVPTPDSSSLTPESRLMLEIALRGPNASIKVEYFIST